MKTIIGNFILSKTNTGPTTVQRNKIWIKETFLAKLPSSIKHKELGTADLQMLADVSDVKGAGYQNEEFELSSETFGANSDIGNARLLEFLRKV